MRILVEEYQYNVTDTLKETIRGLDTLEMLEGVVSVNYVGYYYNTDINDCVFILPKVVMTENRIFGKYNPQDVVCIDSTKILTDAEHRFIYEFAVWIYRAIAVFQVANPKNGIVYHREISQVGNGRKRQSNTYLDILLSLLKFNKENQDFLFFTLKNIHSGFNKINWTKTIAHSAAYIQEGTPTYLNVVNRKKQINFDEELLIIFFSILNYIHEHFGFPVSINVNFPPITGKLFDHYLKGFGKLRLQQIKYKYFSDRALQLWKLCFAFFERSSQVQVTADLKEYLLVKNFNIVFEAMIDELIGDNSLSNFKNQKDGKIIDHIYRYDSLINSKDSIYYIGDSKYYKDTTNISDYNKYKQYTYAKNVIQYSLNYFLDNGKYPEDVQYRDETTEGYNITPNFFISAFLDKELSYSNDGLTPIGDVEPMRQFENRLFDRDTLLLAHYDVNFLYVVSLYARSNESSKHKWKEHVRNLFRTRIQETLVSQYDFYAMTPKEGINAATYIQDHFQLLLGKLYTPFADRESQKYFSLALDKDKKYAEENDLLISQISDAFHIVSCELGKEPYSLLPKVAPSHVAGYVPNKFLPLHYLEKYGSDMIVVGCYHNQAHLDWILGKNDKGTQLYNVRLSKERDGAQKISLLKKMIVKFAVLYEEGCENDNKYRVFKVHHHASMDEARMRKALYPNPQGKYFCYVFDEEVTIGKLDISKLISEKRIFDKNYVDGTPIFIPADKLIEYRTSLME